MTTAAIILRAMQGSAILRVAFAEDDRVASVPISGMEGNEVFESPLVEPSEPGLLDNRAQSFVIENAKGK
jgi:hypothetical protein